MSICDDENLKKQLQTWSSMLNIIECTEFGSTERSNTINTFVRSFVPLDVTEDDIIGFSTSLIEDKEFCSSMFREITCCATGELVEKIEERKKGGNKKVITFTILPPVGTLQEDSNLDIVREVAFITLDGSNWRAEG